jgi:hypothetical protein
MTTAATHQEHENTTEAILFVACALREKTWKLGCTPGHGQKPRTRTVPARQQERVRGRKRPRPTPSGSACKRRRGAWL